MTVAALPRHPATRSRWTTLTRVSSSKTHLLLTMVAVALLLRLIVVAMVFRDVAAPGVDHGEFGWEMGWVARSLATHQGFSSPFYPATGPTALMPPLYPFLLAGVFRLFGVYTAASAAVILSINSLLSALTCVPVYFTAARAFDRRTALWSGWLWALYPFSIYFSAARVWDYALTGLLFANCLWFALRLQQQPAAPRLWITFGLLFSLTCLSNPSVTLLFPAFLLIALYRHRRNLRPTLTGCLAAALAFALGLAPWTARNYATFHTLIPVRSGFWLEFEAGNHGDTSNSNPPTGHPASDADAMARYQQQGEVRFLDHARIRSQAYVLAHPGWFAQVTGRRIVRFWTSFWSLDPTYRRQEPFDIPATFYCSAMLALVLFGLWHRRRLTPELAFYLAILILFPIPYYLTHSSPDYRQPIEPELITLVACGLLSLKRKAHAPTATPEATYFRDNLPASLTSKS